MSIVKLCLVLGPEGSGKTLLLRKLKEYTRAKQVTDNTEEDVDNYVGICYADENQTLPTVGTAIEQLKFSKKVSCNLKEYGGQMIPLWPNAYKDTNMIIYVIDSSSKLQVSVSTVALLDLLSAKELEKTPLLLFFNKTDLPLAMSLSEYQSVMRLEDIVAHASQPITVVDGTCWLGKGIDKIYEWISSVAMVQ